MRLTFSYRGALETLNRCHHGPSIGKGGKQKAKQKRGGGGGGAKTQNQRNSSGGNREKT